MEITDESLQTEIMLKVMRVIIPLYEFWGIIKPEYIGTIKIDWDRCMVVATVSTGQVILRTTFDILYFLW